MTTTLPAISGLLRRCSPCLYTPDEGYPIGTPPIKVIVMGRDDAPPEKRAGEWTCNGVDEALWLDYLEAWGLDRSTPESRLSLDLADPTGFGHALLWLGAKYGVPTDKSLSFHAMHDPQPRWSYPIWGLYADGEPVFSMYDAAPGHAGFGPRALLIPGCKGLPRLEALRLAVLSVAGVQV